MILLLGTYCCQDNRDYLAAKVYTEMTKWGFTVLHRRSQKAATRSILAGRTPVMRRLTTPWRACAKVGRVDLWEVLARTVWGSRGWLLSPIERHY
jgi:hypothetical protein